MQLHTLSTKQPRRRARQIGRGGKRGKTAGRGTKGQRARAGNKIRPEIRDLIKKLPKKRGYRFRSVAVKPVVVNLADLAPRFAAGERVTPTSLRAKNLVRFSASRPVVKVLGRELNKALIFSGLEVSLAARQAIVNAGGQVK